jgi:hypothetical protein
MLFNLLRPKENQSKFPYFNNFFVRDSGTITVLSERRLTFTIVAPHKSFGTSYLEQQ